MLSKKRILLMSLIAVFLLMTSCSALKITGAIIEKEVPPGATFSYPVIFEVESRSHVQLLTSGTGFTIDKTDLYLSPETPGQITVRVTAPAQGYIKVTALNDESMSQVQYGVSTYIKVCVNKPCPTIPRSTPAPAPAPTTITTVPTTETTITIEPTETTIAPLPKEDTTPYPIIALFAVIAIGAGLYGYLRHRQGKR